MKKKTPRIIEPTKLIIVSTEKIVYPAFSKYEIKTAIPLPNGYIRCIVMKDYNGMTDELREGDIIDLPERRYKSLSFRGMVKVYEGNKLPNRLR